MKKLIVLLLFCLTNLVHAQFTVTVNSTASSCEKGSALVSASGGNGTLTYIWSNGISGNYASGLDSGMYFVTITDAVDNDTIINVYIPAGVCGVSAANSFSPNGDGVNDTWYISGIKNYTDCLVQVYNRYGQKVFESDGSYVPWDGKFLNAEVPIGTYYYIIEYNDKYFGRQLDRGSLTIMR